MRFIRLALLLAVVAVDWIGLPALSATGGPGDTIDYEYPPQLAGTIHDLPPADSGVRFTFKRQVTREGGTLRVLREYRSPDGTVVAVERVRYAAGRLTAFELDERQTGATGRVDVAALPGGGSRLNFEYRRGPDARTETRIEETPGPVVVNDMIAPYLAAHWAELQAGKTVSFRLVALDRKETVGFKLMKEREDTFEGRPVTIVRMKPTSPVIALIVDPLFFTVEPERRHRILRYTGRTTPKVGRSGAWREYDALTEFDWAPGRAGP